MGFGGKAVDRGLAVGQAQAAAPLRAPLMREDELVRAVFHRHIAIARVAQEAAARDGAQAVAHGHHATVQRRLVAQQLARVLQHRIASQLPGEGRRNHLAAGAHEVAEAVAVLHGDVEPVGKVLANRPRAVERAAPQPVAARIGFHGMRRRPQRTLGDDVQRAARLAAAVERSGRALEELDALHAGQITRRVEAAPRGKAVEQGGHAHVLIAGQAANDDVVPQAAKVVLARDAAHIVQHIVQLGGSQVVHGLARDHAHRLRQLAQRQVGLGACRLIGVIGARGRAAHDFHGRQQGLLLGRRRRRR
ncbi:MAG: hypothetical protein GAK34_01948 [Delftia tsuruhatensis]|nr:MAG: hypothetical protein GAK34_01948 [Delftia tsuruhatensis]